MLEPAIYLIENTHHLQFSDKIFTAATISILYKIKCTQVSSLEVPQFKMKHTHKKCETIWYLDIYEKRPKTKNNDGTKSMSLRAVLCSQQRMIWL